MISSVKLHPTNCAICGTIDNSTELYSANFDLQAFNPDVFSARRLPDQIHYRMVKCKTCGLVRADPIIDHEVMAQLYKQSSFNYADELANLKFTYGRYLAKLANYSVKKSALLEIGCGNGFFLEEALAQGYVTVRGVEPSTSAVEKASPHLRLHIVNDIMRQGLFEPEQFDVICMFQVLDHITNPGVLLDECFRVLKPKGLILCLNHNIEALSARFLKECSPIIDIEHTYLYSLGTITNIFSRHGFRVVRTGSVYNTYTAYYLSRLLPLPALAKRIILTFLRGNSLGRMRLSVSLGNLYLVAQRSQ